MFVCVEQFAKSRKGTFELARSEKVCVLVFFTCKSRLLLRLETPVRVSQWLHSSPTIV